MDPIDHAKTGSNGKMAGSDLYRANQKKMIDNGRFGEAIQMDIDDIRARFGTKYDEAIKEMLNDLDPWMKIGLRNPPF
jgi:filamentous hemagglutinin